MHCSNYETKPISFRRGIDGLDWKPTGVGSASSPPISAVVAIVGDRPLPTLATLDQLRCYDR